VFKYILFSLCLFASVAASANCEDQLNAVSRKLDFKMIRTIQEASAARENLSRVYVLGILKTTGPFNSEQLLELFQDEGAQIRAVIRGADLNIITFTSSLTGVLNVAKSDEVISIQISGQRLRKLAAVSQ
jgi:hypothetical protein